MNTVGKIITCTEKIGHYFADVMTYLIMVVVFSDVVLRYLFNRPLFWAYDLISLYLMAGIFFLSLASTYSAHSHVGIDILIQRLSANGKRLAESFTCTIAIPFFSLLVLVGAERAYIHWLESDAVSGLIAWPTWISAALVPIGCSMLVLRLTFRLVGHIASLATGKNVIELLRVSDDMTE